MKKIIYSVLLILPLSLYAQKSEGYIEYQEKLKLEIEIPADMQQFADRFPTEQKTNMLLQFNEKESLYKISEKSEKIANDNEEGEGLHVEVEAMVIGGGASTVTYCNNAEQKGIRAIDMMGKQFLVSFTPGAMEWKILDEHKEILGYPCIKATTEHDDTKVTAWFTSKIPMAIGPDRYGGLPGAILAMEMVGEENEVSIAATEVILTSLKKPIKEPKKGEAVSESEFTDIVEKRMEMMREMNGGEDGNIIIRREVDID